MRRMLCVAAMLLSLSVAAQETEDLYKVMRMAGVTDVEDIDACEMERLWDCMRTPLRINEATVSRLEKSGLFTPFQIASLVDYRSRHGDIMSYTELSALDGFGNDRAEILRPFISLESKATAGTRSAGRTGARQNVAVRGGGRTDLSYMYGAKYRMEYRNMTFSVSCSKPYSEATARPSYVSGNISWDFGQVGVVLGDFNARFGQGLCMWNSTVISGLTTPSAFMRRPSGISPTYSFTGSAALTGAAADFTAGRWKTSVAVAIPDVKDILGGWRDVSFQPVFNLTRYGRYGHVSMTHYSVFSDLSESFRIPGMMTSADASFCVRGVNLFAESAYDWVSRSMAAVCGSDWSASEALRLAALLKYCPSKGFSNEYGVAVSGEYKAGKWMRVKGEEGFGATRRRHAGNFSADAIYHPESKVKDGRTCVQIKAQANWVFMIAEYLLLRLRVSERFRTWGRPHRTDLRAEVKYLSDLVLAALRMDALKCAGVAVLGYMEGGYTGSSFSSYLRAGAFMIDDWDDRIYVYERDAPDSFNVPAYYGRGMWAAFNIIWKPVLWCSIYLRASWTSYLFMPEARRKPGRAELKLQTVFRF